MVAFKKNSIIEFFSCLRNTSMRSRLHFSIAFAAALHRFRHERKGSVAVEFALISVPFLALLFAIFETAILFFAQQALETATHDTARMIMTGEAQMAKLFGAELQQKVGVTALQVFGMEGQASRPTARAFAYQYALLRSVANTIEGGTSEVQRSVIAQRGLGLPRE